MPMTPDERVLREVLDDLGCEKQPESSSEHGLTILRLKQAIRELVMKQVDDARNGKES